MTIKFHSIQEIAPPSERLANAASIEQRFAVAKLVGYCDGILTSGRLTALSESHLRLLLTEMRTAFDMPSRAECQASFERTVKSQSLVAEEAFQ